jgi:hypothetical protein
MNSQLNTRLQEIVKDKLSSLCTQVVLGNQHIADVHNVIYRYQDDAFVIDIRQNLPQRGIKENLERKLHTNLDNFEDFVYKIITPKIEVLSNELGVKVYFYGILGGFIGIEAKTVNDSRMIIDYDLMIKEYTNMFLSYIEGNVIDLHEFMHDEIYPTVVLSNFLRENIEYFYKYINSPILQKFQERAMAIISTEFTQEKWVEELESVIKTSVSKPFPKFEDLLEMTQYFERTGQVAKFNDIINKLKVIEERMCRGETLSYYRILAIFHTYWNAMLEPKNTSTSVFKIAIPPEAKEILIEFMQSLKK